MTSPTLFGELPLVGAAGEPVDLLRTIVSHGLVELPPMLVDQTTPALEITLPLDGARPRTVHVAPGSPGFASLSVYGRAPSVHQGKALTACVRHVLRLDDDLSGFYLLAASDPTLAWATSGAGRMIRSPSVFEDVVKTICTTNCAWSATVRMVAALVEHLGERAPGAPATGPLGRTFPTPAAMASAGEDFYRESVRAGYRGPYLHDLAAAVASRSLDLESFADPELPEPELERRLLELPGVGPYAAAHVMMLLGRHSLLVLDSWTRPKYAHITGGRPVKDATIVRRFRRYGRFAGLAFWLTVTADWA